MPRLVLSARVCAGLLSSLASPALDHAARESATPWPGDRVTGSPKQLVAHFSEDLDPTRPLIEVRDGMGARAAGAGELGNGLDASLLIASVVALAAADAFGLSVLRGPRP